MSTPLDALLADLRTTYLAARDREGCPWTHLDGVYNAARAAAASVQRVDWMNHAPATKVAAVAQAESQVRQALVELARWRDMPDEAMRRQALVLGAGQISGIHRETGRYPSAKPAHIAPVPPWEGDAT